MACGFFRSNGGRLLGQSILPGFSYRFTRSAVAFHVVRPRRYRLLGRRSNYVRWVRLGVGMSVGRDRAHPKPKGQERDTCNEGILPCFGAHLDHWFCSAIGLKCCVCKKIYRMIRGCFHTNFRTCLCSVFASCLSGRYGFCKMSTVMGICYVKRRLNQ